MNNIREFVRSGGGVVGDDELLTMIRAGMLMAPLNQQRSWLKEVELTLDAYGTKPQLEAAARVRGVLQHLSAELLDVRR